MNERLRYSMLIQWSDVDEVYIVSFPEWGDLVHTHGESYEEAARSGQEVLEMLVEFRQENGEALPEPQLFAMDDGEAAG